MYRYANLTSKSQVRTEVENVEAGVHKHLKHDGHRSSLSGKAGGSPLEGPIKRVDRLQATSGVTAHREDSVCRSEGTGHPCPS